MQGESIGVPVTRRGLIKAGFGVAAFREDGPVVTTQEGQLRGIATEKLHIFKGIRYGETTAGANRFRAGASRSMGGRSRCHQVGRPGLPDPRYLGALERRWRQ